MSTKSTEYFHSRYVTGGTTDVVGERIGWWERKVFGRYEDDMKITIQDKYNKRPDLLSYALYGKVYLFWIILLYNNIVDIEEEFITGRQITVPSKERVYSDILRRPTRK